MNNPVNFEIAKLLKEKSYFDTPKEAYSSAIQYVLTKII